MCLCWAMNLNKYIMLRNPVGLACTTICEVPVQSQTLSRNDDPDLLHMSLARVVVPDAYGARPYGRLVWVGPRMAEPLREL